MTWVLSAYVLYLLHTIDHSLYDINCLKSVQYKLKFIQFPYDYHSLKHNFSSLDYKKCCQLLAARLLLPSFTVDRPAEFQSYYANRLISGGNSQIVILSNAYKYSKGSPNVHFLNLVFYCVNLIYQKFIKYNEFKKNIRSVVRFNFLYELGKIATCELPSKI